MHNLDIIYALFMHYLGVNLDIDLDPTCKTAEKWKEQKKNPKTTKKVEK